MGGSDSVEATEQSNAEFGDFAVQSNAEFGDWLLCVLAKVPAPPIWHFARGPKFPIPPTLLITQGA